MKRLNIRASEADRRFRFPWLHVGLDKRRENPVFLFQKVLGRVVLQNVAALHHNDQVGCEDGVDTVLERRGDTHN